jgi:excisionase family DNA binding protein
VAQIGTATNFHGAPVVRNLRAMPGGGERLLTVREVAEYLAVCTATVHALCASGELPHFRVSNSIRVAAADLMTFVANGRR